MTSRDILLLAVAAIGVVNSALILILFRQVGLAYLGYRPARGRDGIPEGLPTPAWEAADARGRSYSREGMLGQPLMLLFAEAGCAPCHEMMKQLRDRRGGLPEELRLILVGTDDHAENATFATSFGIDDPMLAQADRRIARAFRVEATPFGFAIDADGVVRWRGFVNGTAQIDELVRTVCDVSADEPRVRELSRAGEGVRA